MISQEGKMSIKFEFEKETKGTIRYKEVSDDPVIGTLYIRKSHMEELGISGKGNIVVEVKEDAE